MLREQILNSPDYWTQKIQLELFNAVIASIEEVKDAEAFAEKANITQGVVSNLITGDFDGKLSELVQIVLAAGKVPVVSFVDVDDYFHFTKKES